MSKLLIILIYIGLLFGELRCGYKALMCNWEPIGKAEVFYTASFFTGLGAITGYFNIEDK